MTRARSVVPGCGRQRVPGPAAPAPPWHRGTARQFEPSDGLPPPPPRPRLSRPPQPIPPRRLVAMVSALLALRLGADPLRQPPDGAAQLSDVSARDRPRHDKRRGAAGGTVGTRRFHELAAPEPGQRPGHLLGLLLDSVTTRSRPLREDRVPSGARQRHSPAAARSAAGRLAEADLVRPPAWGPGLLPNHRSWTTSPAGLVRARIPRDLPCLSRQRRLGSHRPLLALVGPVGAESALPHHARRPGLASGGLGGGVFADPLVCR